jgi:hydroxyacylglutathione hydrolase
MSLKIETFVLGEISNNTYLVWDQASGEAAIIDPSFKPKPVIDALQSKDLNLTGIWLTHGHFDHFIGIPEIISAFGPVSVYLHPDDGVLFAAGGLGRNFGFLANTLPAPEPFPANRVLNLGSSEIVIRETPGHSPGHVIFYAIGEAVVFTGDLIFRQSVGRTDLPGSDQDALLKSIYEQVLTLPGETRILPGHNDETTVADEVEYNPYLH